MRQVAGAETAIPHGGWRLAAAEKFGDIGYAGDDLIEHGYRLERRHL